METPSLGALIARGRTAEVYAWQDNLVLKLYYDWCQPHWAEQEIAIGRAIAAMALPTPRLVDALVIDGRQGIVYERADGPSLLALAGTKPWLLFRSARQLAELHARIHRQDGTGLAPLRAPLKAAIEGAENLPPGLKAGVLRLLEGLPDGSALCHGDFHPDQVLSTAKGPVIIDWMTACRGHPLADVARTSVLFMVGQVPYAGPVMRAYVDLWRGWFHRAYLARYLELTPGATRDEVTTWMVPLAAARLREGIAGEEERLLGFIRSHLPAH